MSDAVPNDVPLDEQEEGPDPSGQGSTGELDDLGEGLDERGLAPEPSPADPVSPEAGMAE